MNKIIFYLSLCFILCSCQTTSALVHSPLSLPTHTGTIIETLNTQAIAIQTVKAHGTVTINNSTSQPRSYSIIIFFAHPDQCMLRAYKPLIPNQFQATTAEGKFHIFLPRENTIVTGRNEDLHLNNTYDIALNPEYIRYALFPQKIKSTQTTNVEVTQNEFIVSVLNVTNSLKTQARKIWFSKNERLAKREDLFSQGGLKLCEIIRRDFVIHKVTGMPLAQNIIIKNNINNSSMILEFDKIRLNEMVEEDRFNFFFPSDMNVEDVQ